MMQKIQQKSVHARICWGHQVTNVETMSRAQIGTFYQPQIEGLLLNTPLTFKVYQCLGPKIN
jgi:hypothetical protein